jgi:hypothetical protein
LATREMYGYKTCESRNVMLGQANLFSRRP